MGYLEDLRKKVGNLPLVVAGVTLIVLNEKDELLLIERLDNQFWGLPSGSVELNESVESAAKRELYEETGLETDQVILYHVTSGPGYAYTYPNGDQCSFVTSCFYTRTYTGTIIKETDETTNCAFIPLKKLPSTIPFHEQQAINYFLEKIYPTL